MVETNYYFFISTGRNTYLTFKPEKGTVDIRDNFFPREDSQPVPTKRGFFFKADYVPVLVNTLMNTLPIKWQGLKDRPRCVTRHGKNVPCQHCTPTFKKPKIVPGAAVKDPRSKGKAAESVGSSTPVKGKPKMDETDLDPAKGKTDTPHGKKRSPQSPSLILAPKKMKRAVVLDSSEEDEISDRELLKISLTPPTRTVTTYVPPISPILLDTPRKFSKKLSLRKRLDMGPGPKKIPLVQDENEPSTSYAPQYNPGQSHEMLPWSADEEMVEEEAICSEGDDDVFED